MEVDKHEILITAAPTDSCWFAQYPTATELDAPSIKVEAFSDGKRVYSSGQQPVRVEFISDWEKYFPES